MAAVRPQLRLDQIHCDHVDPSTKICMGTYGLGGSRGSLRNMNANQELLDELAKCEPVCFDCHKTRTRLRSSGHMAGGAYEQRALF